MQLTSSDIEKRRSGDAERRIITTGYSIYAGYSAAFAPAYIGWKVFVDGGLTVNYPANEVRDGCWFCDWRLHRIQTFTKKRLKIR